MPLVWSGNYSILFGIGATRFLLAYSPIGRHGIIFFFHIPHTISLFFLWPLFSQYHKLQQDHLSTSRFSFHIFLSCLWYLLQYFSPRSSIYSFVSRLVQSTSHIWLAHIHFIFVITLAISVSIQPIALPYCISYV